MFLGKCAESDEGNTFDLFREAGMKLVTYDEKQNKWMDVDEEETSRLIGQRVKNLITKQQGDNQKIRKITVLKYIFMISHIFHNLLQSFDSPDEFNGDITMSDDQEDREKIIEEKEEVADESYVKGFWASLGPCRNNAKSFGEDVPS